ncbi:MAG: hypothetical protein IIB54_14160 [Planctomycetes bacterium]|nr:hypothetical protein [Planctomycetota bacterium]
MEEERATDKQKKFMHQLGVAYDVSERSTKAEARAIIDAEIKSHERDLDKPKSAPVESWKVGVGAVSPAKAHNGTAMYTSYAKDIFVASMTNDPSKDGWTQTEAEIVMEHSIALVKQAREAFS